MYIVYVPVCFVKALPRYTFNQLLHTTDNMAKSNFLGQGGFGSVYIGKVGTLLWQ